MAIAFSCPQCNRKYRVEDHFAGKSTRCKNCGNVLTIPQAPVIDSESLSESVELERVGPPPLPPSTPVAKAASAPVRTSPKTRWAIAGSIVLFDLVLGILVLSRPPFQHDPAPAAENTDPLPQPEPPPLVRKPGLAAPTEPPDDGPPVDATSVALTVGRIQPDPMPIGPNAIEWRLDLDYRVLKPPLPDGVVWVIRVGATQIERKLAALERIGTLTGSIQVPLNLQGSIETFLAVIRQGPDGRRLDPISNHLILQAPNRPAGMLGPPLAGLPAAPIPAPVVRPQVPRFPQPSPPTVQEIDDAVRLLANRAAPDHDRRRALEILSKSDPTDGRRPQVVPPLLAAARDRNLFNRSAALEALAVWADRNAVPDLVSLLQTEEIAHLRSRLMEILASLKDARGAIALVQWVPTFRPFAANALRTMGPVAEPAVLKLMRHPDPTVRSDACEILERIGTDRSRTALRLALSDPHSLVRYRAQQALAAIGLRKESE